MQMTDGQNRVKSSCANSHIRQFKSADVSETAPVSIIGVRYQNCCECEEAAGYSSIHTSCVVHAQQVDVECADWLARVADTNCTQEMWHVVTKTTQEAWSVLSLWTVVSDAADEFATNTI